MRVSSYLTALKFENILPPILKIKYTNIPQILYSKQLPKFSTRSMKGLGDRSA